MSIVIDDRTLASVPVFPLPDVVLFPGTVLPLHVFEQRYRDLTRDVLAADRVLAVARLRPGYDTDYYGRPPIYDTCGVGVVVAEDALDDGRYNILVRGVARIAVDEELPAEDSYRRARARLLADDTSARPEVVTGTHAQLLAVCERLADAMGDEGDQLRELAHSVAVPAECADVLGAALVTDPDDRQTLLETLDPADRLDIVLERVSHLIAKLGPSSALN